MSEPILLALAAVLVLGIAAQWLAWWIGIPSILLLLGLGFLAGPVTGLLNPDAVLGDLLLPVVSLSVALILYEGGLSLRFRELRGRGGVLWSLVTVGATVTWLIAAGAAWLVLGFAPSLAILLGAILVVTGPTVIMPLLRTIRPKGQVGAIVKWEGIIIDPIGAMLAVLVFEVIRLGEMDQAARHVIVAIVQTIVVGGGLGVAAGLLLTLLLRLHWVPDYLQNAVSLMLVVAAYTAAQFMQPESGLFTATAMGMTLANQRFADIRHIVEFKENLQVLLISSLFILLAARLKMETLAGIGPEAIVFVLILIAVARPLSVMLSTLRTSLPRRDRTFLALMAPRGIVAASVSAVFALRLQDEGFENANQLVPTTFLVIVGTVIFSSLAGPFFARRMGVADPNPQGVLLVGAHAFSRELAVLLKKHGFRVLLVDSNRENVQRANLAGLETFSGDIVGDRVLDEIELGGIGKLIAATPNHWVNLLAMNRFARIFGRNEVYQLAPPPDKIESESKQRGTPQRWLFGKHTTYSALSELMSRGASIKATSITPEFTYEQFRKQHGDAAIPLFVITESKRLIPVLHDQKVEPKAGQTVISLIGERADAPAPSAKPQIAASA